MPHSILSFSHSKHTCAGCGQLAPTEDGKLVTDRAVYTLAWGEMIETAKQGCLPCLFLTAIMMELEASGTIDVDVARRGTDEHSPAYPGYDAWTRMNIQLDRSGDRQRRHYNVMTAEPFLTFRCLAVEAATLDIEHTGSDNAVEWVKRQIDACLKRCNQQGQTTDPEQQPLLPKRILFIGETDGSSVRLMESAGTRGRYACLSHCWGANPIIKTEHSTLERYKQDIPLHDLPKTFQDAINFLRRMGVDYLWIDSLCIIQDSEDDWAEESAKMAEIYMNGFITIAATRGAVATTGLYSPMEDVNLSFPNGACFILRNRVVSHPGTLLNDNRVFGIPRVEENPFPLLGRGWVVQEMVLSQRVLHFCENELVFECDCGRACTCGFLQCEDNSLFNIADRTALKDIWPGGINGNHGLDSTFDLSRDQASSRWRNIVEYYGLCRLTFEKDKLPAISGIAWLLHKRYNIKYMAGLWLESIHTDLLWSTARAQHEDVWTISEQLANAGLNESTFVLPTWSWISATTRLTYMHAFFVEHEDGETIKYISVAKADCTPRSPLYPFGELKSAELVLNGWLLPIKVDLNYLKHGRIEFTDKEGCPFSGTLYLDKRTQISVERDSSGLFGVPIVKKYCHKDNIICMYFGLVVRKIEEGTGYERVGLWRLGIMDRDDELQKEAVIDTFFQTLVTELIVLV